MWELQPLASLRASMACTGTLILAFLIIRKPVIKLPQGQINQVGIFAGYLY
jgi:hypothetical protein